MVSGGLLKFIQYRLNISALMQQIYFQIFFFFWHPWHPCGCTSQPWIKLAQKLLVCCRPPLPLPISDGPGLYCASFSCLRALRFMQTKERPVWILVCTYEWIKHHWLTNKKTSMCVLGFVVSLQNRLCKRNSFTFRSCAWIFRRFSLFYLCAFWRIFQMADT